MFKEYFLILLCGHLLGDFYFQSQNLVDNKSIKGWKKVLFNLQHAFIYFVSTAVMILPVFKIKYTIPIIVLTIIHFFIDLFKSIICNNEKLENKLDGVESWIFSIDQFIHIVAVIAISIYLNNSNIKIELLPIVKTIENCISIDFHNALLIVTIILLNGKPFNLFIKKVFNKFQPNEMISTNSGSESIKGAGSVIGFIERMLIAILYYNNQFAIIGLVITAKSVARYKKITDNAKFAEYYLMGTLSSTLFSIISVYFICWAK